MNAKVTTIKAWNKSTEAYYEGGQVYAWDSVAGHFTTCHSLTEGQKLRVKRLANRDK